MANIDCAKCGRANEPGTRFCTVCGVTMEPQVQCAACSHPQSIANGYCMSCGAEMSSGRQWHSAPADGAVMDGVWERTPEEFIRRVDREDMRTRLGNQVVRVPAGTVGVVLIDGVVDRVLPPGQQTTVNLFERIAHFFTGKGERTAFYLIDLRPVPIPFSVQTRPSAGGRTMRTQVLVSFSLQRGNKEGVAGFIANVLGDRAGFSAGDLYNLLRPEVTRLAGAVLERMGVDEAFRFADAEAEIRSELTDKLGPRYGLGIDVTLAALTAVASLNFHLGTGQAQQVRDCDGCGVEMPSTMKFCDSCGHRQTTQLTPSRLCTKCGDQVADDDRFCNGCGTEYHAPAATVAPLFSGDGEQLEVDIVVRVQGQHDDFAADKIAPALVGAAASHLRSVNLPELSLASGFSAMEAALAESTTQSLASYGLQLVSLNVVDVRSKTGQWLLGARADLNRSRSEVMVGREWLEQRAEEIDLAELTFVQKLAQNRVEREAQLKQVHLDLSTAQRERTLRAADALNKDRAALDDRRRRQDLANGKADLDVADAERAAERDVSVAQAQHQVEDAAKTHAREGEREALDHEMAKEVAAVDHDAALARKAMALNADKHRQNVDLASEGARQSADDAAYAARAKQEVDQEGADADQQRQLDKLRAMAEMDQQIADQDHERAKEMREGLRGMSDKEMIAAQATELAKGEDGGKVWAEALAGRSEVAAADQRVEQAQQHAGEMKDVMSAQLDRMEKLTTRAMEGDRETQKNAGAAAVYEGSMDAMSRVAASRAAAAPVVAGVVAETPTPCKSCGAPLRSASQFCGGCGEKQ